MNTRNQDDPSKPQPECLHRIEARLLIEDTSNQCPSCKKPLVWLKIATRQRDGRDIHELHFGCDSCQRRFIYGEGSLRENLKEPSPLAEAAAMKRGELDAALRYRCPACGGPISNGKDGPVFSCQWCNEDYKVENGELIRTDNDLLLNHKPKMSDFYAVHTKR